MFYFYLEDIFIAIFAVVNSLLIASGAAAWIKLKFPKRSVRFITLAASLLGMTPYFGLFFVELANLQQCISYGEMCAFPVGTIRWKLLICSVPIGLPLAWIAGHYALKERRV